MPVDIHPKEKVQRRRADPHAPARRRQILRQELPLLRRPARRRRLGRQRAVEAPRVLGQARRQGIQHQLQGRQSALEAGSRRHGRPSATPAPRCASGRTRSSSTRAKFSVPQLKHVLQRQGRAVPGPARPLRRTRRRARRTSGSTPAASAHTCRRARARRERLPRRAIFAASSRASSEEVDWARRLARRRGRRASARATSTSSRRRRAARTSTACAPASRDAVREFCEFRNLLPRGVKLAPEDVWDDVLLRAVDQDEGAAVRRPDEGAALLARCGRASSRASSRTHFGAVAQPASGRGRDASRSSRSRTRRSA